ncbi:hypothetical protein [Mesorhizobium sp. NZP2077]|uniref:hypothetical protein n=1 Tax=Mesorhizobium sp. NZP2077 TaxID=2483404 RepID=UPI0015537C26|nr:hypothetical protein [Mesorhizobium sp. NZP2077]QKC84406.1 hypothetical protein EB232_24930 [Mesorhizobium sp. NZP2077]QKD17966.1 hypothetical protein HGP13_24630 [Mesorhizobium sp. NZP2077]
MTSAVIEQRDRFRIGRVLGDSFAVIGRNFILCFGVALVFLGLPRFLIKFTAWKWLAGLEQHAPQRMVFAVAAGLIAMVLAAVLQAALVRVAIEDLNGKRPATRDCIGTALSVLLPAIGISLLTTLGAALGLLLLIVPGIILFLRWSAAAPVLVQERRGVFASMARSSDLTEGSRWALLGLWVIVIVAASAMELVMARILPAVGAIAALSLDALDTTLIYMLSSILPAVSYVELRRVKEGASVDELAEIFS